MAHLTHLVTKRCDIKTNRKQNETFTTNRFDTNEEVIEVVKVVEVVEAVSWESGVRSVESLFNEK